MPNKRVNINNNLMNQVIYKEINVNKVVYKTLTTTNFNSKSMRFLIKSTKNTVSPLVRQVCGLGGPGLCGLVGSKI